MDDPPVIGAVNTNYETSHFRLDSSLLQQLLPQNPAMTQYGTSQQWFLHCEYRDCQRTDLQQAHQCPVLPENRCKLYESRELLTHSTFFWGPLTLGPFIVKSNGPSSSVGSQSSSNNQWFVNGRSSVGKIDANKGEGDSTGAGGGIVVGVGRNSNGKATSPTEPQDRQQAAPPQQLIIMEGLDPFLAVGIAFATFVLGIVLVAAIWCIHTRTGPVKSRAAGHVSVEGSGDLTPNSSSPMTA